MLWIVPCELCIVHYTRAECPGEPLRRPVGNEHVRVAFVRGVAVAGEHQLRAIGREHGEAVEGRVARDRARGRCRRRRSAQRSKSRPRGSWWFDAKMIRLPSGYQYGAKLAPLSEVTWRTFDAVAIHHVDLERRRPPEAALSAGAGSRRAPCRAAAGGRGRRSAIRQGRRTGRHPGLDDASDASPAAVRVHRVDLHVAVAHAREHDACRPSRWSLPRRTPASS